MNVTLLLFCLASLLSVTSGWLFFDAHGYGGRNPFLSGRHPWRHRHHQGWGFFNRPSGSFQDPAPPQGCHCPDPNTSLNEKLRRLARDNDHNHDGVATSSDVIYDVSKNYDTNDDGVWTESECVKRWTCAYSDTTLTATYICAVILQGEPNITISAFNNIPSFSAGMPLDTFLQVNRERYQQFSTNQCVNQCLSVEEKLSVAATGNDKNGDGRINSVDVISELSNNMDTDKDGRVTKAEWVARWVCAYGDTGDFARAIWDLTAQGNDSIDATNPPMRPGYDVGLTISEYKDNRRNSYTQFAQLNQRDCVDSCPTQNPVG